MRESFVHWTAVWIMWATACSIQAADVTLVSHGEMWRFHKGTNAPQAGWTNIADVALNAEWGSAAGGFGYGDPGIAGEATTLGDMEDSYRAFYIRRTFEITNSFDSNLRLKLLIDFDDGFVAYLDGLEVARTNAPGTPGTPVAHTTSASSGHEASCCDTPNPPVTFDLGPVGDRLPMGSHLLAIQGLNQGISSSDFHLIPDLFVGPTNPPGISGTISTDTTWTAANSPYVVTGPTTVASGVTLTIEPGVTVLFNQGVRLTVNGRLLAEGTAAERIRFTRNMGAVSWNGVAFNNNTLENRLVHVDIQYANAGGESVYASNSILLFDHVVWSNITQQVLDINTSSIILRSSIIPSVQGVELFHFAGTIPGYAIVESNVFGSTISGYADVIDFTGGNRPGPILQFLYNTMLGTADDMLDLDSTDAHVEGNVFMDAHKRNTSDSLSHCVTTGKDNNNTSEITVVRNIFYDCDHAVLIKGEAFGTIVNNTFIGSTWGFISFGEPGRGQPAGRGAYLDGNIFWNPAGFNGSNFANVPANLDLTVNRCLLPGPDVYPGIGNLNVDPRLMNLTNIMDVRNDFRLRADSPALGAGPNGLDMGAFVPAGASISGEPASPTMQTDATLTINGPGIVAFRYKVNNEAYSSEILITNLATGRALLLTNLTNGTYTVCVVGKNSAGTWQSLDTPTVSKAWTVMLEGELRIVSPMWLGDAFAFRFDGFAGKTYSVKYRPLVDTGPWMTLTNVGPLMSSGPVQIRDPDAPLNPSRYYQVLTPIPE